MYRTSKQWERFGRVDPYYGVVSEEEFRRRNIDDDARARFFASGEEHVTRVLADVRRLVGPDFAPRRVLDHGCGVGRLVVPFAARAEQVVGVDVSPSMLAEARRNCDARDLRNVELVSADRLHELQPGFDLVHSFIVLQHVAPREGRPIFETLARLVRPGGVGVVHVPIASRHWLGYAYTWIARTVPFAYNVANLLRGRPWSYPHMQMYVYGLNDLGLRLMRQGYEEVHVQMHPGQPGRTTFASCILLFGRPDDQPRTPRAG